MSGAGRPPIGAFFALFTVSGFAGLIYQSIWSHYLKLFLGHAAYAQTLVLAIFMGGMAIGAWLVSRYTHRIGNLLLGYAIAELGIGVLALVFHRLFVSATGWAFDSVIPALGGQGVDLFKWTLASALILPASILLGTTFPLMSAGVIRLYPESGGRALSMLYFTNSFGAAIGVLASGFYLVDRVGLPGAIFTAGLFNVALALAMWLIVKRTGPVPAAAAAGASAAGSRVAGAILLVAFLTGAASFIYEVTWIRMLALGLGASTHSFEVMLAAFILGMSLGAYWIRNRIGAISSHGAWLAALLLAKAVFAVYAVWVYDDVLDFIVWTMKGTARTDAGYVLMTMYSLAASMIVMLPTAFVAGMTLPLATYALGARGHGEAAIGKVYGANTLGCILGAWFATHAGMEALGIKGLTGLGALLDAAMGALAFVALSAVRPGRAALAATGAVAAFAAVLFFGTHMDPLRMSAGVFRYGAFDNPATSAVRFYRDGKTATVSVIDNGTMRNIRTNGKVDASIDIDPARPRTKDETTMALLAALPLAIHPEARTVANIGFGSGMTTHTLLGSPRVREVDTIEIERMMVEGARNFHPFNRRAFEDPRSHVRIEDAKTFFAASGKRYDIIISEPSNPWVSGVATLFSDEFYARVRPYLNEGGLFVQWVQVYEINHGLLSSIFQALGRHFEDYVLYTESGGSDLLVVAARDGKVPGLSGRIFEDPGLAAELSRIGYPTLAHLQAARLAGRATMHPFFAQTGYPVNSDYYPIVDQRGARSRFKRETSDDIRRLREHLVPTVALLDGEHRVPAANGGAATQDPQARAAWQAIGTFIDGPSHPAADLPAPFRVAVIAAHQLGARCAGAEADWLGILTDIVRISAPHVPQAAVQGMLAHARASACHRGLPPAGRDQLAFLEAVNARDADAMATVAERLLEQPGTPAIQHGQYLLAALSAHLARGRGERARALMERHGRGVRAEDLDSTLMRLVLSHLRQLPATVGPAR